MFNYYANFYGQVLYNKIYYSCHKTANHVNFESEHLKVSL